MPAYKAWRKGVWTILSTQLLTLHLTLAATWHMTEPWHHSLSAFGHFPITPPIRSTLYLYPRSRSLPLPPHLPLVPCSQRFVGISSPDLEIPRSCLPFGKEHCMGRGDLSYRKGGWTRGRVRSVYTELWPGATVRARANFEIRESWREKCDTWGKPCVRYIIIKLSIKKDGREK